MSRNGKGSVERPMAIPENIYEENWRRTFIREERENKEEKRGGSEVPKKEKAPGRKGGISR